MIDSKKTKSNFLLYIGLILFFLSGTAYVTDLYKNYHNAMLIAGIFFVWIDSGFWLPRFINLKNFLNPFILFILTICISFFLNNEVSMVITIIGLLLLWFVSYSLFPYSLMKKRIKAETVYCILIWSLVLVFIYSFVVSNFRLVRYEGIFTNPNACGGVAATLCSVAIATFLQFNIGMTTLQRFLHISSLVVLISCVVISLITTSRTSVLTILGMLLIMSMVLISEGKKQKKKLITFSFLLILVCGIFYFSNVRSLLENILTKFEYKEADELNGRMEKWLFIIDRLKWFGNGEKESIAAHNTYLSLLDQYGVLSAFFWLWFVVKYSLKAYWHMKNDRYDEYRYLPFFSFVCFGVMGLTEGMMLKTIMLLCMFSVGVLKES